MSKELTEGITTPDVMRELCVFSDVFWGILAVIIFDLVVFNIDAIDDFLLQMGGNNYERFKIAIRFIYVIVILYFVWIYINKNKDDCYVILKEDKLFRSYDSKCVYLNDEIFVFLTFNYMLYGGINVLPKRFKIYYWIFSPVIVPFHLIGLCFIFTACMIVRFLEARINNMPILSMPIFDNLVVTDLRNTVTIHLPSRDYDPAVEQIVQAVEKVRPQIPKRLILFTLFRDVPKGTARYTI